MRIQETVENEMIEIAFLLTIGTILESVCNSQSSKAVSSWLLLMYK